MLTIQTKSALRALQRVNGLPETSHGAAAAIDIQSEKYHRPLKS